MNQKQKKGWLKHLDFMILDLVCLELAYLVAWLCRDPDQHMFRGTTLSLYTHLNIVILIIDVCYVLLQMTYKNILKRGKAKEIQSVLVQNIVIWGLSIGYLYLFKQAYWFSRTVFVLAVIFSIAFMLVGRFAWKYILRHKLIKGTHLPNFVIITTEEMAYHMLHRFKTRGYNGFNILGFVIADRRDGLEKISGIPVIGNDGPVLDYFMSNVVDEVMICLPQGGKTISRLTSTLLKMGIVVHIGLDYEDVGYPNRSIDRIGGFMFLTTSINTAGSSALFVKRVVDVAAGLIGCAFTGIAFVFVAPLIYKASPGPIFFAQERMGKNGRKFKMYKFRSMYMDAEERKKELMAQNEMQGNMFKMKNDPRIIGSEKGEGKGIGNVIRRLSIDELPQFYNILKGDMSLVGTRPPTVGEFEEYDLHHKIRLSMKPGLTGMWQVSGRSSITDFEEIVRLDASYIENWSLRLDAEIILKTFKVVFAKEGAE